MVLSPLHWVTGFFLISWESFESIAFWEDQNKLFLNHNNQCNDILPRRTLARWRTTITLKYKISYQACWNLICEESARSSRVSFCIHLWLYTAMSWDWFIFIYELKIPASNIYIYILRKLPKLYILSLTWSLTYHLPMTM